MYKKEIDYLKDEELKYADLSKDNEVIVETAGFVPLEVKFKRFEQNGMIAQFKESEFSSSDLRNIYLSPDFEISPEDDFEEVTEKIAAQNRYIEELRKSKAESVLEQNTSAAPQAEIEDEPVNGNQE